MAPIKRPSPGIFGQDDIDDDGSKKKARMAKLAAWKANRAVEEATLSRQANVGKPGSNDATPGDEEGVDPLDAFMSSEVLPEVNRRREEEMRKEREERQKLEMDLKAGRVPKALQDLLADGGNDGGDSATTSDEYLEMQIPGKMLKRLMGPGGETIKQITLTSGCKIQVAKGAQAMKLRFGASMQERVNAHLADSKSITLELRGSKKSCEHAKELVLRAIDNKTERERHRALAKEKREDEKYTKAHIYKLRHAKDFEALELSANATKEEIKQAYRRLAMKWHPDKNPDDKERAEQMFAIVDRAYKNLTTSS